MSKASTARPTTHAREVARWRRSLATFKPGAAEAAVERASQLWNGLDVLVNNAAYGVIEPFLDAAHEAWTRRSAQRHRARHGLQGCRHVMLRQRGGRIVNITSPGSRMALPDYAAYTASKAAVDSITRARPSRSPPMA